MTFPGRRGLLVMAACASMLACAPTLDWRDVRPAGSDLVMQFPCRPEAHERKVVLAGSVVRLALYACNAGSQTWALSVADVAAPALVEKALAEMRQATAANLRANEGRTLPLRVPGATPAGGTGRLLLSGHRPDGRGVELQLALFAHGTHVFQATVLGERLSPEDAEDFVSSVRFER